LRFEDGVTPDLKGRLDGLVERADQLPDRLLLYGADGEEMAEAVHALGIHPASQLVRRSSLEDVFLRLTGRSLVE
jgi:lipooligosaccharide transport system ATP-binding protein